jgi:hypothetical protein
MIKMSISIRLAKCEPKSINTINAIICDEVIKYEEEVGGIILDASKPPGSVVPTSGGGQQPIRSPDSFYFWPHSAHTVTPRHASMMRKKGHLVLLMLELRIGQPLLIQVCYKNSLSQFFVPSLLSLGVK